MKRSMQLCLLLCLVLVSTVSLVLAQAPVGTIAGIVSDETGAVVPNATVTIRNNATGFERQVTSALDGSYSAPALAAGVYEIRVEMKGFRTLVREATVEVGGTTTADIRLLVGQTAEVVNVEAATAQIEYERHAVDGVITRQQIQGLPANGRSFMQLAALEPGVTVNTGTTSQYNALFSVSILGGNAGRTAITVDGGNVRDAIESTGTQMNFSQEVVQEFQVSSANFDLSTGITSVGAINMVTRSGANAFHGSGYFFFRDHNMSAYPGLARDSAVPDPFFARRNPGFWVGGPIVKDKLFFFFNYEYMNQTQAFTVHPDLPSIAPLGGTFFSPYKGKTLSARFDYKLNANHSMFARYSHDGNSGLGPNGGSPLPSNWLRNTNWSDQTVFDLTSTLRPTLVNDFRFNYAYWHNRNLFPNDSDCPDCIGLHFPQLSMVGSSNFAVGDTSNATQGRDLRRFNFIDGLTWQKGAHRFRFGGEIEYAPGTGFWGYCDPGCFGVLSPEYITGILKAATGVFFPNLPSKITSNADLLNLPVGTGGVAGIGDPSQPPPYNVDQAKVNNRFRIYGQDTWKIRPNFTLNYGLAWEYESTLFNNDLPRPQYLAPIYGPDLSPTHENARNFSPSLGFAWNVGKDNKTVVRAGAGIYYDTEDLYRRLQERSFLGPVGNGRIQYPFSGFTNIYPGIIDIAAQKPVPVGAPLPTNTIINMTLGQFLALQAQEQPVIAASLAPKNLNDLSVRGIQRFKSAAQLYPLSYPTNRSYQMNVGVQREVRRDLVVSVDFVRRVFVDTLYGEIDLNRYNRFLKVNGVPTRSPVIPQCTSAAQVADVNAECSQGTITFWVPGGRGTYNAMLVKANKRFASRYQVLGSYALAAQNGINNSGGNPITNLDNYFANYGPQGPRHILNVSALVDLPWGFQFGFNSFFASRGPVQPLISGVDLTGSGITTAALPGIPNNGLNRGYGKSELAAAVAAFNQTYAGKPDGRGQAMPTLILPPNYALGDNTTNQDIRLTKRFVFRERYKLSAFGEMFNVFNIANLSGYNFNLDTVKALQTFSFGQPTQRATQVFGSGGPRALQVGARFEF